MPLKSNVAPGDRVLRRPADGAASTKPRWADSLREWLQRFTQRRVTQSVLLLSNHSRNLKPSSVSHLEAATAETTGFL